MSKKGPLSKAEAFYAEEKYKAGKSIEEISNELDRSNVSIQKHVDTLKISPSRNIVAEQFVHQNGATIITENASTMIDANRKKRSQLNPECVTKLKWTILLNKKLNGKKYTQKIEIVHGFISFYLIKKLFIFENQSNR